MALVALTIVLILMRGAINRIRSVGGVGKVLGVGRSVGDYDKNDDIGDHN